MSYQAASKIYSIRSKVKPLIVQQLWDFFCDSESYMRLKCRNLENESYEVHGSVYLL